MSDEVEKQKCEVPGCKAEASLRYWAAGDFDLCDEHNKELGRWYSKFGGTLAYEEAERKLTEAVRDWIKEANKFKSKLYEMVREKG